MNALRGSALPAASAWTSAASYLLRKSETSRRRPSPADVGSRSKVPEHDAIGGLAGQDITVNAGRCHIQARKERHSRRRELKVTIERTSQET